MRQTQFQGVGVVGALLPDESVDVGFVHLHPQFHFAFAHALQQQLAPQFVAQAVDVQAFGGHSLAKFFHAELVLGRDRLLGLGEGRLVHTQPQLVRLLLLGPLGHQLFQHEARQLLPRR
ncbi:hypothetical protein D9M69_628240 [compost metagenome]